jgi:hypothetical protein
MKTETLWDVYRSDWRRITFAAAVLAIAGGIFVYLWMGQ